MDSPVVCFYDDAHILITGGTGFMGKVLIEKLLRSCPGISQIYLLIRTKKDTSPEDRLQLLFKDELYDTLKSKCSNFMSKISLIEGDCSAPGLGISDLDRDRLQSQVTHVFHNAATVNFNAKLDTAIRINVLAVREMIQFCKLCPNIKVLLHTSTAFAYSHLFQIDEKFYPPPMSAEAAMTFIETFDKHNIANITPKLIEPWPNTYCYSKSIAESLIRETAGELPVGIFRPTIVSCAAEEPIRGWIDNLNTTVGVIYLSAMGVNRVLPASHKYNYYCVPVDKAINAQICAAWKIGMRHQERQLQNAGPCLDQCRDDVGNFTQEDKPCEVDIFNFFGHSENIITWVKATALSYDPIITIPAEKSKWKLMCVSCSKGTYHRVVRFLLHDVPARVIDFGCNLLGKKRRMRKLYNKIHFMMDNLAYFSNADIIITGNNCEKLWKILSPGDQIIFPFHMKNFNWPQYMRDTWLGVRLYLFKEPLSTLAAAKKKQRLFEIAHYTLIAFLAAFCILTFYIFFKLAFFIFN